MRYLSYFKVFEKTKETEKNKIDELVEKFKKDYGTKLEGELTIPRIMFLFETFKLFDKSFIRNKIPKIIYKDIGNTHGTWHQTSSKKEMTLNPKIFHLKKDFENGDNDLPYELFILVHEIGHCIDHVEKISFSKEWQAISGWKRCGRHERIPDGYDRYIERRPGKGKPGRKKSEWVYKEDADFIRAYTAKNPREDFADSFAFGVFGHWHRFKGEGGKKKMEIIKRLLKKID